MACYSITKFGFLTINELMADVINELTTTTGPLVDAGSFENGITYKIVTPGTTDFVTLFAAADNLADTTFTAVGITGITVLGTGTATIVKAAPYFTMKFPAGGVYVPGIGKTILESTTALDPIADVTTTGFVSSQITNAWRLCFNQITADELSVHAGTALQFKDDGTISYLNNRLLTGATNKEVPGNIGADWTGAGGTPLNDMQEIFLNRMPDVGFEGAYPMSYILTLTNRGIFFAVWQDSQEEIPQMPMTATSGNLVVGTTYTIVTIGTTDFMLVGATANTVGTVFTATGYGLGTGTVKIVSSYGNSPFRWFLIQRSVDRLTGDVRGNPATLAASRCPVYCISGSGVPTEYRKFIVREKDVVSPSQKKWAAVPSEDSTALINPYLQQSLTESGEFIVTFITNLSTPRYKYSDELDMLGTVSASVIGAGSTIDVTVYGEATPRTYTALYANQSNGNGMRLMVLTKCSDASEDSHIA